MHVYANMYMQNMYMQKRQQFFFQTNAKKAQMQQRLLGHPIWVYWLYRIKLFVVN